MKLKIVHEIAYEGPRFHVKSDVSPQESVPKTRAEALRLSIEKWTLIVALRRGDANIKILDGGSDSCGLCVKYYEQEDRPICGKCPVALKSGRPVCQGTPYREWSSEPTLANAKNELAFLKTLLQKRDAKGRFVRSTHETIA